MYGPVQPHHHEADSEGDEVGQQVTYRTLQVLVGPARQHWYGDANHQQRHRDGKDAVAQCQKPAHVVLVILMPALPALVVVGHLRKSEALRWPAAPLTSLPGQAALRLPLQRHDLHLVHALASLVSHGFSAVSIADLIVVLDRGHVIEMGTYTNLLSAGGTYAELYRIQEAAYRWVP